MEQAIGPAERDVGPRSLEDADPVGRAVVVDHHREVDDTDASKRAIEPRAHGAATAADLRVVGHELELLAHAQAVRARRASRFAKYIKSAPKGGADIGGIYTHP